MSEISFAKQKKFTGGICTECGEVTTIGRKVCAKCKDAKKKDSNWFPAKKTDGYYLPFLKNQLRKWDFDTSKAAQEWANSTDEKKYFTD